MTIDERSRHELYVGLEEVLGRERADTMMAMLPPVGWADVATKHDLDVLRAATKQDIELLRLELHSELKAVHSAIQIQGTTLGAKMATHQRNLVVVLVSLMLAINGVGVALAGIFG